MRAEIDIDTEGLCEDVLEYFAVSANLSKFGEVVVESLDGNREITNLITDVVADTLSNPDIDSDLHRDVQALKVVVAELSQLIKTGTRSVPEEADLAPVYPVGRKILREWLGGSEELDFLNRNDWDHFLNVVQNEQVAVHLHDRLFYGDENEIVVNESEPQYIERYTKLP